MRDVSLNGDFLDLVYEAAFSPESWYPVLDGLARTAGGRGTVLLTADPHDVRWISSRTIQAVVQAFFDEGWQHSNGRLSRLMAKNHPGFLREIDIYATPEELENDPNLRDFYHPRGMGYGAGTLVPVSTGDMLVFSIERDFDRGPVEAEVLPLLDQVRQHLARAALLSARLRLEQARAATETLGLIGLPAAVLKSGRRVTATNALFDKLDRQFIALAHSRLGFADTSADELFGQALERLTLSSNGAQSFPVAAKQDHPALVAHLVPVSGTANDIFAGALSLLVLTPLGSTLDAPPSNVLHGLFDLSPAEARAARAVLDGRSMADMASDFAVSLETIRTQVKAVLAKTGTANQTELVCLLASISLSRKQAD